MKRRYRWMTGGEIDQCIAETREMARQHPEVIIRKTGEYMNLIVQGCKLRDEHLVELGHVCSKHPLTPL